MHRLFIYALAAMLAVSAPQVFAQSLGYTYISLDYIDFSKDVENVPDDVSGDGVSIDVSYALRPHIALTAGYSLSTAGVNTSDVDYDADIDAYSIGFVIHAAINENADFIVGAGFINGEVKVTASDGSIRNVDEDGGMTTIGFRAIAYDSFEFGGFVRKNSIEDSSSYSLKFSASYYAYHTLSLDLGYLVDSEGGSDLLSLGLTTYF